MLKVLFCNHCRDGIWITARHTKSQNWNTLTGSLYRAAFCLSSIALHLLTNKVISFYCLYTFIVQIQIVVCHLLAQRNNWGLF